MKEIQNLRVNSSFECLLCKTFSPLLKIPYCSKFIVETVTEVHSSNISKAINAREQLATKVFFFPKFDFEMINLVISEKYLKANFLNKTFDLQFYAPQPAHSWTPNIW